MFKICIMLLVELKTSVTGDAVLTADVVKAGKTELEDEVSTCKDVLPSARSEADVLATIKVVKTVIDEVTLGVDCSSLLDVSAVVVEAVS